MNIQSLKDYLTQVNTLHNQEKYVEAFQLVEKLLVDYPYSVELLVKRAKIIQLLDNNDANSPSLETAKESLIIANVIAPQSIEPYIELGYFEYAINNCPGDAINYFNVAKKNAELGLKEALIGEIKCYIDMNKISEARKLIEKAKVFFPHDSEIGVIEFELQEYE
jgi:tetratricopeptide (TPR) repeat protein